MISERRATPSQKQSASIYRGALPTVAVFFAVVGCSSKVPAPSAVATPPPLDPWVITNLDPNIATPALLWNGLVGVRWNGRFGASPKGVNEHFDIGHFQNSGEEKIVSSVGLLAYEAFVDDEQLLPGTGRDFTSRFDIKSGIVTDSWMQSTRSGGQTRVKVETAMHPTKRALAQKWTIRPEKPADVFVQIGPSLILSMNTPSTKNPRSSGLTCVVSNSFDRKIGSFKWYVKDSIPLLHGKVFERVATCDQGSKETFTDIAAAAKSHWSRLWQTDIQIDGPVEDQQFIRSALFYLRGAIHPGEKMSISPMGLSSDIYNGHVFWDADIWVFPALALIDPERAKAIPEYRLKRLPQASKNFNDWWQKEDRPTGNGKMGFLAVEGVPPFGIKFPWESSVSGKETVPGPSKFEDHITGSIAFSMSQASDLGLISAEAETNFLSKADQFYRTRSNLKDGQFEIKGTMSPDENHIGDNDLYTNLVAQWCMNNASWDTEAVKKRMTQIRTFWAPYKLPKDDKSFLTYDNDALRGYKQAAAVLSIYPLQYPPAEKQAKVMMERFSDKVTKNGPAMTDSIHSIIWSRLGEKEKAYQAWHDSWKPFVKPPFLLFSEKRNSSRTYFTTGAAGSLQAVLYGFAGIRIDAKKAPGAQWSIPLKNGKILSIAPNLPKEWKKLTLRNLTILGKKYTFEIVGDKVTVSQE